MTWSKDGPQGAEAAKVAWDIVRWTRGRVLDLGCGPSKCYPHFTGVDSGKDRELFGIAMKPDFEMPCEKLDLFASQSWDSVFSSHLLEHYDYKQVPDVLKEWMRVIKVNGYLVLYLPDEDEYPKVGEDGANPDHKFNVNRKCIIDAMPDGFDLIHFEKRNQDQEYSLLFVFRKLGSKARKTSCDERVKPAKTCGIVRYGAIGDVLQAASILPGLKAQGYHITFYTVPSGYDLLQHDPHVDEWVIQDHDQVPNSRLGEFWTHESKKYDKWINLSGTVEEFLLAVHPKPNHAWPQEVRHKYMNVNYLEFTHDIAGVPLPPRVKFYATPEEKAWAKEQRKKLGPSIMYCLAGSSVHKVWPHMDTLLARIILKYPHRIVTVGKEIDGFLEQPWRDEPRVACRAGKWTVRQTLAYALECDAIVGPETGVMNAMSMESMRKILFLSHSSHENLTRDWVNTCALEPVDTPCYPCHRMHYGWDHCHAHEETGVALCATNISADRAWNDLDRHLRMAA